MSGFMVISNREDGVRVELKVTYNSVGATQDQLQQAVVDILPAAYLKIEEQLGVKAGG